MRIGRYADVNKAEWGSWVYFSVSLVIYCNIYVY